MAGDLEIKREILLEGVTDKFEARNPKLETTSNDQEQKPKIESSLGSGSVFWIFRI